MIRAPSSAGALHGELPSMAQITLSHLSSSLSPPSGTACPLFPIFYLFYRYFSETSSNFVDSAFLFLVFPRRYVYIFKSTRKIIKKNFYHPFGKMCYNV